MDKIDKIIFINLEKRKDRLEEFLSEMKKMEITDYERFNAIEISPGFIGCTASHLEVITLAKERGYKNVLIFEDDFEFIVSKETLNKNMEDFFKINQTLDWKVVMLSYNLQKSIPCNSFLGIATEVQTASGYLVNSKYYDQLIQNLTEGLKLLKQTHAHWLYINDQYWKKLQTDFKWFYFLERIGKQRSGWSDLGNKFVEYEC